MVVEVPQVVRFDTTVQSSCAIGNPRVWYTVRAPGLTFIIFPLFIDSRLITWVYSLGDSCSMKKSALYDHRSHIRLLSRCEKTTGKVLAFRPINNSSRAVRSCKSADTHAPVHVN